MKITQELLEEALTRGDSPSQLAKTIKTTCGRVNRAEARFGISLPREKVSGPQRRRTYRVSVGDEMVVVSEKTARAAAMAGARKMGSRIGMGVHNLTVQAEDGEETHHQVEILAIRVEAMMVEAMLVVP